MTLEEYYELIKPYTDAMNLILTRLEILDHDTYETENFKPIHSITNRIKEKESIENKLKRKAHRRVYRTPSHCSKTLPASASSVTLNRISATL